MTEPTEDTIPDAARTTALAWRQDHLCHVSKLLTHPGMTYAPSGSDVFRPELWRSPHWRWLKESET